MAFSGICKRLQLAVLTCMWAAACVPAAAQAAYSARYYYPPGQKKVSRYHIYYINLSNGHTSRLTSGSRNDVWLKFSPNGKYLAFVRVGQLDTPSLQQKGQLCLYSMQSRRIVHQKSFMYTSFPSSVHWNSAGTICFVDGGPGLSVTGAPVSILPHDDPDVSPDGSMLATVSYDSDKYVLSIKRRADGRLLWKSVPGNYSEGMWQKKNEYLLANMPANDIPPKGCLQIISFTGGIPTVTQLQFHAAAHSPSMMPGFKPAVSLEPCRQAGNVLLLLNNSNSTTGEYYGYWRVNLKSGETAFLGYATYLQCSSSPGRYYTLTGRTLAPYGRSRQVWVTQLVQHNGLLHTSRILVGGLVNVRDFSLQHARR